METWCGDSMRQMGGPICIKSSHLAILGRRLERDWFAFHFHQLCCDISASSAHVLSARNYDSFAV